MRGAERLPGALGAAMRETRAEPPFRPVRVLVVDGERLPGVVDGEGRYGELWALVREGRRPRGMVRLAFEDGVVSGERLSGAVAELPALPALPALAAWEGERLPRISVVMASLFERVDALERCVASLRAVEYPDFEVIVVDNRRVAEPVSIEGVRVVHEPRPGLSAARNRGLAVASGEIVAFTDDDVEVDPVWLLAIALRLRAHPEEAGVTGLILAAELETQAQLTFEEYYGGFGPQHVIPLSHRLRDGARTGTGRHALVEAVDDDGSVVTTFPLYATGSLGVGANMAFRTDVLRRLGGFDEALGPGTPTNGGEELAVFAQLVWRGHSLGFEPAALVRHSHRREDDALRLQVEAWGRGFTAMLWALVLQDPGHISHIAAVVPTWLRWLRTSDSAKRPTGPARPRELVRAELAGMARGPIAYARARRWQRRWTR